MAEYEYRLERDHAVITGGDPDCMVMRLPEQAEGLPVTEIAPHAFEGSRCPVFYFPDTLTAIGEYAFHDCQALREMTLPDSLLRLGSYAFYDCHGLRTLSYTDGIQSLDNNSFLGCDSLTHITFTLREGRHQSLKTILSDLYQEIEAEFVYPQEQKKARIVFPEYFVEYVENHPARIFEEFTIGSGRVYRKCFAEPDFDYTAYDRHFEIACLKDLPPQAARVAVARLRVPYRLGEADRVRYILWLKANAVKGCVQYVERGDLETLTFLQEAGVIGAANIDAFLDAAQIGQGKSVLAWLMQVKHRYFQKQEKSFDL